MNILGMGPMEILLIVVLALIVFGPAKLPEIMGQVGKAIGDFRRATSELSDEFNRTIQAEIQETKAVVEDTKSAVTGVHTSINAAISGTAAPALTTPASAQTLTTAPTNGVSTTTNGTNGTSAPAEHTPPLADTAQWSWETAAPAPSGPAVETLAPESVSSAPANVTETPPATVTPPVSKPAEHLTRTRKSAGRDDLLPPY
jgi:TatA/E family protein of Tat protein translocase